MKSNLAAFDTDDVVDDIDEFGFTQTDDMITRVKEYGCLIEEEAEEDPVLVE